METNKEQGVKVSLVAQYTQSIKFELIKNSYELSQDQETRPQLKFQINPKQVLLGNGSYRVSIEAKVDSEIIKEKETEMVFHLEVEYAGIFNVEGIQDESVIEQVLLVDCAMLLFPFLRQELANTTLNSGYPPVLLAPLDLRALYAQYKSQNNAIASS